MISEIKNESASISVYTDPFNKRIRIDDYSGDLLIVLTLISTNIPSWIEKLIVKVREFDLDFFQKNGFSKEAFITGYFDGAGMYFMVKYYSNERAQNSNQVQEEKIIESILQEPRSSAEMTWSEVSLAVLPDAIELAGLYASVFKVYPTSMSDPDYVLKTMEEGTIYVVIREHDKIVSAASAEIVYLYSNAELTDCATLPEAQGKGHMKKLLSKLEEVLKAKKINCLYTIARAESYSMNKVFYQLNYSYGGRLTNNCFIFSGLEDMNVWFKMVTE